MYDLPVFAALPYLIKGIPSSPAQFSPLNVSRHSEESLVSGFFGVKSEESVVRWDPRSGGVDLAESQREGEKGVEIRYKQGRGLESGRPGAAPRCESR